MKSKRKQQPKSVLPPIAFGCLDDRPWETTAYMIEQERQRRESPYFNYGYNRTTGKIERI